MTKAENPKNIEANLDWSSVDLSVENAGEKIVLPAHPGHMDVDEGIVALQRIRKAQNTVYEIAEKIDCHFYDGIVAFNRALKQKYGYSEATTTFAKSFFDRDKPPRFLHVKTGPGKNDFVQVAFGTFKVPGIEGSIETGLTMVRGIPVLVISGQVRAKERTIIMEIVNLTRDISRANSIYRGQSVILERDEASDGIDFDEPLEFFNANENADRPIFNRDVERLIDIAVLGPLAKADECRANKIPLKRGVLLSGPYGTGKSMLAKYVAAQANANNWTFILCKSSMSLKYALRFAKMYQPCVLFAEDIDRMVDDRNEGANDLINDIDGVVGKSDEIVTVLTTNFATKIDKAVLRPGRLDTIVSLREPDAETTERLIRSYAGPVLDPKADIAAVAANLAETKTNPSTIAEVVKKAKLFMIFNGNKEITPDDLAGAVEDMKNHIEILNAAREGKKEVPVLEEVLAAVVERTINENRKIRDIAEYCE